MYLQMAKKKKEGEKLRMEPRFSVAEGWPFPADSDIYLVRKEIDRK